MQDGYANMLSTPIKKIRELSIHSPDDDSGAPSFGFFSSVNRSKPISQIPVHNSSQTSSQNSSQNSAQNSAVELMVFSRQESMSPIRYPSMSDISVKPVPLEEISQNMIERGYSRTLSTKVLRELDTRASEISRQISTNDASVIRPSGAKLKRYSQFHKPIFQKMESISSHYAASRNGSQTSQSKELLSSATKKRRTLNGPEEIFALENDNESPTRRKETAPPQRNTPFMGAVPTLAADLSKPTPLLSSPYRDLEASPFIPVVSQVSPTRTLDPASQSSSPTKFTRISPSKGSMNLNKLLLDDFEFAKPAGPVKLRQSSLQMAGVAPTTGLKGIPQLLKKTSIPSLQKKPSLSSFQSNTSHSLSKKPSAGNLLRDTTTNSTTHRTLYQTRSESTSTFKERSEHSRIHVDLELSLKKKQSFSLLNHKDVAGFLAKAGIPLLNKKPLLTTLNRGSRQVAPSQNSSQTSTTRHVYNHVPNSSSQRSSISQYGKLLDPTLTSSLSSLTILSIRSNITVPKPFSLYNKPTISSSQKSFGAMQSSASLRSLALTINARPTNKHLSIKSSFS